MTDEWRVCMNYWLIVYRWVADTKLLNKYIRFEVKFTKWAFSLEKKLNFAAWLIYVAKQQLHGSADPDLETVHRHTISDWWVTFCMNYWLIVYRWVADTKLLNKYIRFEVKFTKWAFSLEKKTKFRSLAHLRSKTTTYDSADPNLETVHRQVT